jgi:hypothetical protein
LPCFGVHLDWRDIPNASEAMLIRLQPLGGAVDGWLHAGESAELSFHPDSSSHVSRSVRLRWLDVPVFGPKQRDGADAARGRWMEEVSLLLSGKCVSQRANDPNAVMLPHTLLLLSVTALCYAVCRCALSITFVSTLLECCRSLLSFALLFCYFLSLLSIFVLCRCSLSLFSLTTMFNCYWPLPRVDIELMKYVHWITVSKTNKVFINTPTDTDIQLFF